MFKPKSYLKLFYRVNISCAMKALADVHESKLQYPVHRTNLGVKNDKVAELAGHYQDSKKKISKEFDRLENRMRSLAE